MQTLRFARTRTMLHIAQIMGTPQPQYLAATVSLFLTDGMIHWDRPLHGHRIVSYRKFYLVGKKHVPLIVHVFQRA